MAKVPKFIIKCTPYLLVVVGFKIVWHGPAAGLGPNIADIGRSTAGYKHKKKMAAHRAAGGLLA